MAGDSRAFRDGGACQRSVFRGVLPRRFRSVFVVPGFVAPAAVDAVGHGDAPGCCVGKCLDHEPDQLALRFQDSKHMSFGATNPASAAEALLLLRLERHG